MVMDREFRHGVGGTVDVPQRQEYEPTPAERADTRYVCVSAEQVDLTPVPFDWILNKWAEAN